MVTTALPQFALNGTSMLAAQQAPDLPLYVNYTLLLGYNFLGACGVPGLIVCNRFHQQIRGSSYKMVGKVTNEKR
jgi:hypothetical protein